MLREAQHRGLDDGETDGSRVTAPGAKNPAPSDEPTPATLRRLEPSEFDLRRLEPASREWDDDATIRDDPSSLRDAPTLSRPVRSPRAALGQPDWTDDDPPTAIVDRAGADLSERRATDAATPTPHAEPRAAARLGTTVESWPGRQVPVQPVDVPAPPLAPLPVAHPPGPFAPAVRATSAFHHPTSGAASAPPYPAPGAPPPAGAAHPSTARPTPATTPTRFALAGGLPTVAAFLVVVAVGMVLLLLTPWRGRLRIELDAAESVQRVDVFVDGRKVCDVVPCLVADLSPGPKEIRVVAPGLDELMPSREVVVRGEEKVVVIPLRAAAPAEAPATLRVAAGQPALRVTVDGVDRGEVPVEVAGLAAGAHTVRFDAGPRFAVLEQVVELRDAELRELSPPALKVTQGTLTVTLASRGATAVLTRRDSRKTVRVLEGPWPLTLDVEGDGMRIQASGPGYAPFERDVVFPDGNAEAAIRVELRPAGPTPAEPTTDAPSSAVAGAPAAAPAPSMGTISMNSIPPSRVLLDGQPMGETPQVSVSVPAGLHTVTFVHPDLGKKSVSVNVKPGQRASASARFKP